jgi:hypothetical protein
MKILICVILVLAWIGFNRVTTDIDQMITTIVDSTGLIVECIAIFGLSYLVLMVLE